MRADEGILADQVDVVAQDHEVTWTERRVDSARGVRQENRLAAHAPKNLNRQDDRLPARPLVVVASSAPCGDAPSAAPVKDKFAGMARDGRCAEAGDVGIRRTEDHLVHFERIAPAGAEEDAEVDGPVEAEVGKVGGRLVEERNVHRLLSLDLLLYFSIETGPMRPDGWSSELTPQ